MTQHTGISRFFLVLSFSTFALSAGAFDRAQIDQQLREFDQNPQAFASDVKNVEKFDPDTLLPVEHLRRVSQKQKEKSRQNIASANKGPGIRSDILSNDNPANVVDRYELKTLRAIQEKGLMSAKLAVTPWSDDYWPFYLGTLAWRYADPHFPKSNDWKVNSDYILATDRRHVASVNQLSPAEKYDLLVGDNNRTLTQIMLRDGRAYYNAYGSVEKWMGTCAGWAPASFSIDRPTKAIDLLAADGVTKITFYPSDIKALASLLWDRAPGQIRFIGSRCKDETPEVDEAGRLVSDACLNTNPGAWHLSVVNQIGLSKRGLIMDVTADYEVWNQPIYSYSYGYFNPKARRTVSTLNEAYVALQDFSNDPFPSHRSSRAVFVAGVVMDVVYMGEVSPSQSLVNSPQNDRKLAVRYFYDLELDQYGNILGGEWYQAAHPDFLWTSKPGARALSVGDNLLNRINNSETWSTQSVVPTQWAASAKQTSRSGQPLARIVEAMVASSNAP